MISRQAARGDISHVCLNMRDESAAEAFASMPLTRLELAHHLFQAPFKIYTLAPEGAPAAAIVGIGKVMPGRGGILFLATAAFPSILMPAHRWWRREFVPNEFAPYRRVEFIGSLPETPSGLWLKWCGFECEGIARAYGRRGEDLAHWAWVNPCWRTVDDAGGRLACRPTLPARGEPAHV